MSAERAAAPGVVGVVIAGGRSVRFGGEKATAILQGRPLLLWATARLLGSCGRVAVNARPGTATAALAHEHALTVLHDAPGDATGPLAGVKAGLQWAAGCGAHTLAVSPCDAPLLPPDLFPRLLAGAHGGAAMAETPAGLEPLCALWPVSSLAQVSAALEHGAHPPTWRLLESLGARRVRFEDAAAFVNLNTPGDLAAVAGRLAARQGT